ncbi:hypothetical protein ACIBCN_18705 [Nocardia sp. NPDC051052]|uniref:hypothetical protein n=1 Tax=Nocardia sp. NPDC051052 TaxID=3364322 RepID=UPI0037A4A50B
MNDLAFARLRTSIGGELPHDIAIHMCAAEAQCMVRVYYLLRSAFDATIATTWWFENLQQLARQYGHELAETMCQRAQENQ